MNEDLTTGLIAGLVAGFLLMALIMFLLNRRTKVRHASEIERYDASIVDLRQERAEDKETNRRLRHELVAQSPDRLVETARAAELERDSAVSERDQALEQLQLVQGDLSQANGRIADRENKLRQYREALKEIRVALEAQDRGGRPMQAADNLINTDTGELLAVEADPADPNAAVATDGVTASTDGVTPADISAVD